MCGGSFPFFVGPGGPSESDSDRLQFPGLQLRSVWNVNPVKLLLGLNEWREVLGENSIAHVPKAQRRNVLHHVTRPLIDLHAQLQDLPGIIRSKQVQVGKRCLQNLGVNWQWHFCGNLPAE